MTASLIGACLSAPLKKYICVKKIINIVSYLFICNYMGVFKLGQELEVHPGIVTKDEEGKLMCTPIFYKIASFFGQIVWSVRCWVLSEHCQRSSASWRSLITSSGGCWGSAWRKTRKTLWFLLDLRVLSLNGCLPKSASRNCEFYLRLKILKSKS